MPKKAFFIGPYNKGFVKNRKPWLLPENAFEKLNNAFVWRDRVRKRIGSKLFPTNTYVSPHEYLAPLSSRLRIALPGPTGTTNASGNATGGVPGSIFRVGQAFSIGTTLYTVYQSGAADMLKTDATSVATYDTTTGSYDFEGAPALTQIYWYPAEPVMGIVNYEVEAINDEPTYAFDTQFAYQRAGDGWSRLGTATWTGLDDQFFWITNYRGITNDNYYMYVVNNNRDDKIKYWTGSAWATINPQLRQYGTNPSLYQLHSARIIVTFKSRLVLLNTLETTDVGGSATDVHYAQRARWSWNRSPIYNSAGAVNPELCLGSWYEDVPGVGAWADAPTKEAIITARILKDRLIVYFEKSTWELVYTGNYARPFIWQIIDDSIGAESTFSTILLDKTVIGIGETGIHACDGLLVSRIDEEIPNYIGKIHNSDEGIERVAGIRDFYNEVAYWAIPKQNTEGIYPDQILLYNYKNLSWALWDDSITAFGSWQNDDDITWGEDTSIWGEDTRRWGSGSGQNLFKNVIAGNQEGYIFIMDRDESRNAPSLQITQADISGFPIVVLSVRNHNLNINDYILIENAQGLTDFNDCIYKVDKIIDKHTINVKANSDADIPTGAYTGAGTITRISIPYIKTKQYNFYGEAIKFNMCEVAFDVAHTASGILTLNFMADTSGDSLTQAALANGSSIGNYRLDMYPYPILPFETNKTRLYRQVFFPGYGECIQLELTIEDDLRYNTDVMLSPFEINSMTFYVQPAESRNAY